MADEKTQDVKGAESTKRKMGTGEIIFNFGVYGGISWILNEIVSTVITNTIYSSADKPGMAKPGVASKAFKSTVDFLHKNVNPLKWARQPFYLATEMFVMCIGGTLMVFLSKPAEDNKGKIVRWLDNLLTGGKGEADPGIKRAHEEMDAAPKQSWFSQAWGRVLVLVAAVTMHFTMGAEMDRPGVGVKYTAPSTRLLKNTPLAKYSNLSRLMTTLTRDIMSLGWVPGATAEQKALMKASRASSLLPNGKFLWMQPGEGKIAMAMGNTFGYVLSVSAAMATLFYVFSHVLATFKEKDKSKEAPAESNKDITVAQSVMPTAAVSQPQLDKPKLTVAQVEHQKALIQPSVALETRQ